MTASWPANLRDGWNDVGSRPWAQDKTHHLSGAVGSPEQPMGIGVGCILVSALLIAVGANLIRRAAGKERLHRLPHRQRVYLCQPLWLLGLVLLAIGHGGTFVAFMFAADWLVSLLGLSALIWNVLLAHVCNGERLGWGCVLPFLFVLCGLSAFVVFAHPPSVALWTSDTMNQRWLEQVYTQPYWIAHGSATLLLLIVTLCCDLRLCCSQSAYVQRRVSREHWKAAQREAVESYKQIKEKGLGDAKAAKKKTSTSALQSAVKAKHFPHTPTKAQYTVDASLLQLSRVEVKVLRVLFPTAAALLAGWSAILATCLGELLRSFLRYPTDPAYSSFVYNPYEVLFLLIGAAVPLPVQVHLLTRSLILFDAQVVMPIFYVGFVASAVGASGVFFGTFRWACYTWQLAPLLGGLALAILGALLLTCLRRAMPKGAASIEPTGTPDEPMGGSGGTQQYATGADTPPDKEPVLDDEQRRALAAVERRQAKEGAITRAFDTADENKDGKLNREEFANFLEITTRLPGGSSADLLQSQQLPNAPQPQQPVAPWREPQQQPLANSRAPGFQLPPLPMVQRAPPPTPSPLVPAESVGAGTGGVDDRDHLRKELGAQQAQILQLKQAILDLYSQQEYAANMSVGGGVPLSGGAPPPYGYDHASHRLVPGSVTASAGGLGLGGVIDTSSGRDPAKWEVPDGTQAGQVFMVDGKYYVAVAVPATQRPGALPPIPPALPGMGSAP